MESRSQLKPKASRRRSRLRTCVQRKRNSSTLIKKPSEFESEAHKETDAAKRFKQMEKLKEIYRDSFKIRKKLAMLINIEPEVE